MVEDKNKKDEIIISKAIGNEVGPIADEAATDEAIGQTEISKAREFITSPGVMAWDDIDSPEDTEWAEKAKAIIAKRKAQMKVA